jgi:Domain of unknown function (DUF6285)
VTDRPTAPELLEAVAAFLEDEILPALDDHRLRFRTLVALNALGIARRELASEERSVPEQHLRELAGRLRAGDIRDDDVAFLKEYVAGKLRISNPRYLDKYE